MREGGWAANEAAPEYSEAVNSTTQQSGCVLGVPCSALQQSRVLFARGPEVYGVFLSGAALKSVEVGGINGSSFAELQVGPLVLYRILLCLLVPEPVAARRTEQ